MKNLWMRVCLVLAVCVFLGAVNAGSVKINVEVDEPTVDISENLYGIFFEDINFAADGGLYAELIQNRSFEYYSVPGGNPLSERYHPLYAWEKVERGGGRCNIRIDKCMPLNRNNQNYLVVDIRETGEGVGVMNAGFDGIVLNAGDKYDISFYAWSEWNPRPDKITVTLESAGGEVCGSAEFTGISGDWTKFQGTITSNKTIEDGRLVLTVNNKGRLYLDMVSLFPEKTFKNRKNGMRADLAQALADLEPKFFRFPGGCIVHGQTLQNAYRWKDSVGDVAQRRPNWNRWGYHQTYGLGYFEYFQLCEDIGAEPLPVVPVGVSCGFTPPYQVCSMEEIDEWIDDALDLIEFANGPVDSEWGRLRAEMGHPESFSLDFICLGNEEHDTKEVRERYPFFVKAVRQKYPEIKIIGTSGLGTEIPIYNLMDELDVFSSDEHYYMAPEWFLANQNRFDNFDRSKPKIFVGEYASEGNTLFNAIAEAAFLTGVERNGDIVDMTCYAPLFAHYDHVQWPRADMIWFNNRRVVKTPNYYVQQMFSRNQGDVYLENTVVRPKDDKMPTIKGGVGIGSWATAIECSQPSVNGRKIGFGDWESRGGSFNVNGSNMTQTDSRSEPAYNFSKTQFSDDAVTYTVKARKTSGAEGFLVLFGAQDDQNYYWFNVGGWGNSQHAIECMRNGSKAVLAQCSGSIEEGKWYTAKVELTSGRIKCWLDDNIVFDYEIKRPTVSVASVLDKKTGEVILKLVNPTEEDFEAEILLEGVKRVDSTGTVELVTGISSDKNTLDEPDKVKTVVKDVKTGKDFVYSIPAMSVQFIRVGVN